MFYMFNSWIYFFIMHACNGPKWLFYYVQAGKQMKAKVQEADDAVREAQEIREQTN